MVIKTPEHEIISGRTWASRGSSNPTKAYKSNKKIIMSYGDDDDDDEPSKIDLLQSEILELKQILHGVETAKFTPDESRNELVSYCQSMGGNDQFMIADPGMDVKNVFHIAVKGGGGGKNSSSIKNGGGGSRRECCVVSWQIKYLLDDVVVPNGYLWCHEIAGSRSWIVS